MAASIPPGSFGPPYIGESLELLKDPYQFGKTRYERHGMVFRTRFFGRKAAVLLGAEAHKYVLQEHYRNFLWRQGLRRMLPLFGDALLLTDGPEHDTQRKLMTPAFHGRNMPAYLERMNRVIAAQFATWGAAGERVFYNDAQEIAFRLASSLLIGIEIGDDYRQIRRLWDAFSGGMFATVRLDNPRTRYGRALQAKREMEPLLLEMIAARRKEPTADALGLLVSARDEDGAMLTDEQLIAQIKILMFAGYDTTASTMTSLVMELLRHPEHLERTRAEVRADDRAAPVTMEDIRAKPYLEAVIKETLRLHSPAFVNNRGVKEAFDYGGYHIPADWNVMLLPPFSHRMPQYFADPDTFDPDRFLPPREEDSQHPYAWIGFGGGPRICLGEGIARTEIKALVTALLRRFDLKALPDQDFTQIYVPVTRPKDGLKISYQAR
jgi:cytochrome P450